MTVVITDTVAAEGYTQPEPVLELQSVVKRFGAITAVNALDISLNAGELLALLGPSGCGKTTTLRMVAGLEHPTDGEIRVDGKVLASGTFSAPPERRGLGMVFQSYALWPHMNVAENVAYGLKRAGMKGTSVLERVAEVLATVGMADYLDRPVTNLSGGQQQRVAVARALATRPKLLLLDEPLSNLDAVLRESMRFEIRALQQEHQITAIYVTHSQEEALALADVVGIMNAGRLEQIGAPQDVYLKPRSRFVANFIGLANILRGEVIALEKGEVVMRLENGQAIKGALGVVDPASIEVGKTASIAIRPESIRLVPDGATPVGNEQMIAGRVESTSFSGNLIDYFVNVERLGMLRIQSFAPSTADPGEAVALFTRPASCILLVD